MREATRVEGARSREDTASTSVFQVSPAEGRDVGAAGAALRTRSLALDGGGVCSGRLDARVLAVTSLTAAQKDAMWALFSAHYADVARATFESDLARKDRLILLADSGDRSVRGFSTLQLYRREVDGRRFLAIFSGDTIIDPAYWGQKALHRAFVRFVTLEKLKHPLVPVYWFLISKGYKTYLLLTRNFPEHWPRPGRATPAWQRRVLDTLAREKFGDAWLPELGVLRFDRPMGRLREGVAPIDASVLAHPDVRFFAEKNPGHAQGDELCCLGRVGLAQWAYFSLRVVVRALRRLVRLP